MIRPYHINDKEELLVLLRLNTPKFFDPSEEQDYIRYLNRESEHYFVAIEENTLVGAGGINFGFENGKTARISWDLIHPKFQGRGIGSKLTQFRIERIKLTPGVKNIEVRTSQLVHAFYAKNGFRLEKTVKDYWAPGLDLYQMTMEL